MSKISACLFAFVCAAAVLPAGVNPDATRVLSRLPARFEPVDAQGHTFAARGLGYGFVVTSEGAEARTDGQRVRVRFEGANAAASLEGVDRMSSITQVFRGNDPARWRTSIPNFRRVLVRGVYPGVDVSYYSTGTELEYDVILHPGADVESIRMRFDGVAARLDSDGSLVAGLIHKAPVTYQAAADGSRTRIASRFLEHRDGSFGFEVAPYDRGKELVIDPQLTLSVYVSGSYTDVAQAVGHDDDGFVYFAGTTSSTDLTLVGDSFQTAAKGLTDVFLAKVNPNAPPNSQVVYVTYVGGAAADILTSMAVSGAGDVYLVGSTASGDFPLGNAAQATMNGKTDGFVIWLQPKESGANAIYYGTYLGGTGTDVANGVAVDKAGRILVVGQTDSTDFPTASAYQGSVNGAGTEAFVAVIDPGQSGAGTLAYSTYLGGTNWDSGRAIAVAPDGTFWITGATYSGDFPTTGLGFEQGYHGGGDAFVVHFNPDAGGTNSLLYSSYVGGSSTDEANAVAVDGNGRVAIGGFTYSTDFPGIAAGAQTENARGADAFVAVLNPVAEANPASHLVYATFLGGSGGDEVYGLKTDSFGNVYAAGLTKSRNFPVTQAAMTKSLPGGPGGFVAKINPSIAGPSGLEYSSYVASGGTQTAYGVDVDSKGTVYVAGFSTGYLFEPFGGAQRQSALGNADAFVMGFNPCSISVSPAVVPFTAAGGSATLTVTAGSGCAWTVANSVDWIAASPASGTGPGQLTITAAPNSSGSAREAGITVGGADVKITQE
jgi:hypothetical protein